MVAVLQMAQKVIDDQSIEIQQLFGRRSEKVSEAQLSLFAQVVEALSEKPSPDDDTAKKAASKKKKSHWKRRPLQPTRTEETRAPNG